MLTQEQILDRIARLERWMKHPGLPQDQHVFLSGVVASLKYVLNGHVETDTLVLYRKFCQSRKLPDMAEYSYYAESLSDEGRISGTFDIIDDTLKAEESFEQN